MPKYLCSVRFGLIIDADSEDKAMKKAKKFENKGWTAKLNDVEVWGSSIQRTRSRK